MKQLIAVVIAGFFLLLFIMLFCTRIVSPGYVGLKTTNGVLRDGYLQPGLYLVAPFVTNVIDVDTRVRRHDFKDIAAATKEQQTLTLSGIVNYHIDASKAHDLYESVGLDIADKVLDPAFSDFLKETTPKYEAGTILQFRDDIRAKAKAALSANLARYSIAVDDVYISNMDFSKSYSDAIEAAQVAQQKVAEQTNITEQVKQQAEQTRQKAQGDADAAYISAQAQAKSIQVIDDALRANPDYIQYQAIQKWDGHQPDTLVTDSSGKATILIPAAPKSS